MDRSKGIGGSDVAGILGINPFKVTPYEVWSKKIYPELGGDITNDDNKSAIMKAGNVMEPWILEEYCKRTERAIRTKKDPKYQLTSKYISAEEEVNFFKVHSKYKFLYSNIDAISSDGKTLIEVKFTSRLGDWGAEGTDDIPEYYKTQVAHYANIWDVENIDIVVFFPGRGIKIYHYYRDKEYEKKLEEQCVKFWEYFVLRRIAPPPMPADVSSYRIKDVQKDSVQKDDPMDSMKECLKRLSSIEKEIKSKEQIKDRLKGQVATYMGDKEILVDSEGNKLATYKLVKRKALANKRLKTDHPDLYDKYRVESEGSRIFRNCI